MLFKDAHAYTRKCNMFQRSCGILSKVVGPLNLVIISKPFKQWGIDIIGEINLKYSLRRLYILTAMDYFTQWVEVVPFHKVNEDAIIKFLQENIMTRSRVPISLLFDNAYYLSSIRIT